MPDRIADLASESIYAALVDQQSLRVPMIVQTLNETLQRDLPCALVTPGDTEAFLRKAKLLGADFAYYVKSGQLTLHRQKADPALPVFRAGPSAIFDALDRFVRHDGSLVVLDCADPYLFLADPALAASASDRLQQWTQQRDLVVLAAFTPALRTPREQVALRAMAEDFAGLAIVRDGGTAASIEFRHWFGRQGANPRTACTLEISPEGVLAVCPTPAVPSPIAGAESQQVIATERSLDAPDLMARVDRWTIAGSMLDAIDHARGASAGTVVLDFQRTADFRGLCQAVAAVRAIGSPYLTIVVRERGMRLRLAQQIVLTRLGVSTIVARDSDDQGLKLAVQALAGMAFMRQVADDVDGVIARTVATYTPQLLVPKVFGDTVDRLVSSGLGLDLPHVLVHVACEPAKAQQLGTLALQRRLRDAAMTVDPSGLWMLLFACPPARAMQVAERAFGRHFPDVSGGITVACAVDDIVRLLARLARPAAGARASGERDRELVAENG